MAQQIQFSLTLFVGAVLQPVTTLLAEATVGKPYAVLLQVTGGTAPYFWKATGLPEGLTLSATGNLSGTPVQAGSFSPVFTVTDSGS